MAEMPPGGMGASQTSASGGGGGFSLTQFLKGLPLKGTNGIIFASLATVVVLATIIWFSTRPSYQTVFSQVPEAEAARIVDELTKKNIPFELKGTNSISIMVPADRVRDVRMELATQGLLNKQSGVGFEIFDNTSMISMTDFMQRMNYQRALQGELQRTIESIAAVEKARVHLVLPQRSMFVSENKEASASVIVNLLKPLSTAQADGIVHLVSAAVEGLTEETVTLLDHKGQILAGGKEKATDGRMRPDDAMGLQRQKELTLEKRAQDMLEKLVGKDRSIVRITADLDFSRVEETNETFDPDGQVARSEQSVNENSRGRFGVGGVPGVQPNNPNSGAAVDVSGSDQSRNVEKETTNYEISKKVSKTIHSTGDIKRLSISVLVDGTYTPAGVNKPRVYQARSKEEMAVIEESVRNAVGFDSGRGDTITVKSSPFEPTRIPDPPAGINFWEEPEFYIQLLMGLVILALLFFILRPMIAKLLIPEPDDEEGLPRTVAELEEQLMAEGVGSLPAEEGLKKPIDPDIQKAQQMISDHLEEAREILRSWMGQDED
ncbi:flagellar basal-body MS-ring/collar protein FliF [Magnetococcales bacterium HHB-1]